MIFRLEVDMRKLYGLLCVLLFSVSLFGGEIPPKPNTLVNDYAGVLGIQEKNNLEKMLVAYNDSTSNQITVVIESDLGGEEPYTRSIDIAEKWGVGDEKKDNGVLIYISIKDRKMYIQVGRGLEGAIPDALAGRIIEYEITPHFKTGNYYEGIKAGAEAIIKAAAGEYKADAKKKRKNKGLPGWLIILFFIIIGLISVFGKRMRGGGMGTMGRGGWIGGGFGGFGGGGSSGGGGFGGFGGGSFGGGGAGGSW